MQVSTSERAAPMFYFSGSSNSTIATLLALNMVLIGAVLMLSRRSKKHTSAEFETVKSYGTI